MGSRALWGLLLLNFFMADLMAGTGPFLGAYLMQHQWQTGLIGTVMTIGGVSGVLMSAPAGAIIDATSHKRAFVIISGVATVAASALVLLSQKFWIVAVSQVATAVAGAGIGPAVTGITLGIYKQKGFNRQNGRNQVSDHAGNMTGAILCGYLGLKYGFPAVFVLAAAFGIASILSTLLIPEDSIDDRVARGMGDEKDSKANGLKTLLECKPLLTLAAALAFFHLGNGAMLPLFGLAVVSGKHGDGTWFIALTMIIAQATMVPTAYIGMRTAERRGYWALILASFVILPIRGLIASQWITTTGIYPVQILDGLAAGLQSVAVPGLVARLLNRTGRVNVGQGAVLTVQGIGAALSPAIGGWVAQAFGYPTTFLVLGSFSVISVLIWLKNAAAFVGESANALGDPNYKSRLNQMT